MNNENTRNRFKVAYISNKDMLKLITGECIIKNIPEFTRLCEAQPSFIKRGWEILIEHPSFPDVENTGFIPETFVLEIEETGKRNGRKLYFD